MFIAIFLMLITYIIVYIVGYYILKMNEKNGNIIWITLIILGYFIFGFLTYNPIKTNLFYDPIREIYGIQKGKK
ncbi:MAG: hypothetical protein J6D28_01635 [Bacilli bacterium]|nr:hypothetical protein [Bacilli bacterium]